MILTILTACRNARETILDCVRSVDAQRVPEGWRVEHLLLDGCSTDDTVQQVLRYEENRTPDEKRTRSIQSSPDSGFYDALNKGWPGASGEVIGILNSDDFYADAEALARVIDALSADTVAGCYGDLIYVRAKGENFVTTRHWKAGSYRREAWLNGWMPPHPTVFLRKSVYEQFGAFRTDLRSAADYELMLRLFYKEGLALAYVPHVQVAMRVGGMSNRSWQARLQANAADRRAWTLNGLRPRPWTLWMKPLRKLGQWFRRSSL